MYNGANTCWTKLTKFVFNFKTQLETFIQVFYLLKDEMLLLSNFIKYDYSSYKGMKNPFRDFFQETKTEEKATVKFSSSIPLLIVLYNLEVS